MLKKTLVFCCFFFVACHAQHPLTGERKADLADLCVMNGKVTHSSLKSLFIDFPQPRIAASRVGAQKARIEFIYQGNSTNLKPLGSGEMRRQIGVKLDAEDTCNVVYAMWQFGDRPHVAVSRKYNPGMHRNSECLDRGYQYVHPDYQKIPLKNPSVGEFHTMEAHAEGDTLIVEVDGEVAWRGEVAGLSAPKGPVGIRSDNIKYDFDFFIDTPSPGKEAISVDRSTNVCLP